jgi:xylose dehydrogenase (NAD/NADP)
MSERVRWGVLSSAKIGRVAVIPAIVKSGNGTLHAVASRSLEKAQELARKSGAARAYGSYEALLDDGAVDAVYVPLPNHLHKPWTLRALAAGKHVLCEKPLALDAIEAQEMAAAARASGLLLMEAFMYRFHPRSRRIKRLVEEGAIGEPRRVRTAFCFRLREPENVRLRPEMGGGALMDVGCYGVNVARWMLGAEPEAVQAQAVVGPSGVDVEFVGLLRFDAGRLAVVEASFASALQQTYTVVGSEGAIDLPHDAFVPRERKARFALRGVGDERGRVHTMRGADEYRLMVEHFADAVQGRTVLDLSLSDSVANMRVLDALAEAARSGRLVPVGPAVRASRPG